MSFRLLCLYGYAIIPVVSMVRVRNFRTFISIAWLAILETSRQPFFLLVFTFGITLIALFPLILSFTLGEGEKLVRDSALALQFFLGLILSGYAASSCVTHELRGGTAATILTKPVHRQVFFLAKYAGVAVLMLAFSATCTMATLLALRTAKPVYYYDWWGVGPLLVALVLAYVIAGGNNFVTRRPFTSWATGLLIFFTLCAFVISLAQAQSITETHRYPFDWRILPVASSVALAILLLASISLSLAVRLDIVPTLSFTSLLFVFGLASEHFFGGNIGHPLARLLYMLLPNWQHFWVADALSGDMSVPWGYVFQLAAYALVYASGVLLLGIAAFRTTEIHG